MRTIIIAFTQPGLQLAKKAAQNTEGTVEIYGHERCMDTGDSVDRVGSTDSADRADSSDGTIHSFYSVGEVIKEQFYQCDRILFIGPSANNAPLAFCVISQSGFASITQSRIA